MISLNEQVAEYLAHLPISVIGQLPIFGYNGVKISSSSGN